MRPVYVLSNCLLSFFLTAAEEATLTISAKSYTTSELLERPEIENITVKNDPAYGGREMRYRAMSPRYRKSESCIPALASRLPTLQLKIHNQNGPPFHPNRLPGLRVLLPRMAE